MKIFITVGTTLFDTLIEYLDNNLNREDEVLFQIANGKYQPKNFEFISYTTEIDTLYKEYDYIITHGGASTLYKLLDLRKKIIVVPNLERVDHHQLDISEFISSQNHAITCRNFEEIIPALKKLPLLTFEPYNKIQFCKAEEISKIINEL